jgi:hypothetical protein
LAVCGALLLVFTIFVRPQEFVHGLAALSPINVATALAALGILYELATGKQKASGSPQLPWLLAFVAWCFVATAANVGVTDAAASVTEGVAFALVFMLITMYAARSYARYRAMALLVIGIATAIGVACFAQSRQEPQCIALDTSKNENERSEGTPDGRSCESALLCEREGGKDNVNYLCEKVGPFETFTQGWRVRWRGTLGDPNELAVMLGAMIPMLFAVSAIAKKRLITAAMLAMLALALYVVVLTGSRGGQLVIVTVLGVYFVRRYGAKGLLVGAIVGLPVLMFGGRDGEEAESSALERIELLYEGMDMIRAHPLFGVGIGQFQENTSTYLTAHNSYVLAAAELGLPGALLWMMLVYTSIKIPYVLATRPPPGTDLRLVPFAYALVVSFAGILVGIFFLSFCYKQMLFIYFGLSGALYGAAKRATPQLRIGVSLREVLWVATAEMATLAFVLVYSRVKVATM